MRGTYYNEIDPYAAQWLRNLIAAGHIAPGDVDERSIVDVRPDDLRGYTQCHWFAGIGGWSYALRLAGWPDARPVWTGSCPCQPFSAAGKNTGGKDERHLWPHWFRLIRECRPGIVFGENVDAAIGWGWLDAVLGDLEAEGYATGAAVLGAHSVGAPHIRQRLWFVGKSNSMQPEQSAGAEARPGETEGGRPCGQSAGPSNAGSLADADGGDEQKERAGDGAFGQQRATDGGRAIESARAGAASGDGAGLVADADLNQRQGQDEPNCRRHGVEPGGAVGLVADAADGRCQFVVRQRGISAAKTGDEPIPEFGVDGETGPVAAGGVADAGHRGGSAGELGVDRTSQAGRQENDRPAECDGGMGDAASEQMGRARQPWKVLGSPAATEKRGQLNPAFSLWLQGYPPSWDACAPYVVTRGR